MKSKEEVLRFFYELEADIKKGYILAYHGTTTEIYKKIKKKGFKLPDFGSIIRQAYLVAGISWEERKKIPRKVREWIESDAKERIHHPDTYMNLSFAPTYEVASRWAGKGGEVLHETEHRIRMVLETMKYGARTTNEIFKVMDELPEKIDYKDLGEPIIIEVLLELDSFQQKKLLYEVKSYKDSLMEGEDPDDLLNSWKETYRDLRVKETKRITTNPVKLY